MTDVSIEAFFATCPEMLFVANAEGQLESRSAALSRRFGADEITLTALASPTSLAAFSGFLDRLAAGGDPGEHSFDAADGAGALRCRVQRAADGSLHGALHVIESEGEPVAANAATREDVEPEPADADERRQIRVERRLLRAMMENLEIALWAIEPDGTFIYHDGKALATAGMTPGQLLGLNIFDLYGEASAEEIRAAVNGQQTANHAVQHGIHWQNLYIPMRGEDGAVDYVAGITMDVSEAKNAEGELKLKLETIQQQQRAIQELSTPLIEVWDNVLAVPLVGVIDSQRANNLIERLLAEVSRSGARFAVLDLTGVEALDTSTASHLIRLLASIRLLGAEGLITGISPYVAQTMVGIGIDLTTVKTCANLREGLRYCMARMRT